MSSTYPRTAEITWTVYVVKTSQQTVLHLEIDFGLKKDYGKTYTAGQGKNRDG